MLNKLRRDLRQRAAPRGPLAAPGVLGREQGRVSRAKVADAVLSSPRVQASLASIAKEENRSAAQVQKLARQGLMSLVAIQKQGFTAAFDHVLGPMHTRAWTLDVDREALSRLESLSETNTLVFLPTHRSYADPFILTKVLSQSRLPRNYILGGDNIGFWPMGSVVRRSGAILIRRSFGNDRIYKLMLKEYLAYLARCGENLEWYLEGGRSRTGKLRPPMYGLLRYLGQAISLERSQSIVLVPVSITYDQLHEIWSMAEEESGARRKQKEGIGWLARYATMQSRWIGTAYVRFGEPLHVEGVLNDAAESPWSLEKVAIEVFQRINRVTPVTGPAMATLALLAVRNRALTMPEITALVTPLLDYARTRSLPTEVVDSLENHSGIDHALSSLVKAGVVSAYSDGREPVYNIREGSHNIAAFYRNSAIHWFINRAILEVVLLHLHVADGDAFDTGWDEVHALRDLLKFEFFFSEKAQFKEEMRAEAYILSEDFFTLVQTANGRRQMLQNAPFLIAHRVLMPFLEAYFIVADCLSRHGDAEVESGALIQESLKVGRQLVLQHHIRCPESVSQELFKNGVKLLGNRNLLAPRSGLEADRQELKAYLCEMLNAVSAVEQLDADSRAAAKIVAPPQLPLDGDAM